jgi:hypothetical protein
MEKTKVADLPSEKIIPLVPPIEHGGTIYSEIRLREPTADELVEIDKHSGRAADKFAVSHIAAMPLGAVGKLPARPFLTAARYIGAFLGEDQPTGD